MTRRSHRINTVPKLYEPRLNLPRETSGSIPREMRDVTRTVAGSAVTVAGIGSVTALGIGILGQIPKP